MTISDFFTNESHLTDIWPDTITETLQFLNGLGISYSGAFHEPAFTLEECSHIDAMINTEICKNLFLCNRQKTAFYLLLISGKKPFKTKYLSAQINSSRLSFAAEEDLQQILKVKPGSATVLALMHDHDRRVQLLIDRDIADREDIGCHPCLNSASVRLRMRDIMDVFLPAVKHVPIIVDLPWETDN